MTEFTHKSNCQHCYGTLYEGRNDLGVRIPCRNIKYEDVAKQARFKAMRLAIINGLFDPKKPEETVLSL